MRLIALTLALLVSGCQCSWLCPELSARPAAECTCTLPHTLRCAGDHTALQIIGRHLREQRARNKNTVVSLLDCALRGVSALSTASVSELVGVGLHGLVISSGDIRRVQQGAFSSIASTLVALGLPNNQLPSVPTEALTHLYKLDRLDLSNNKIHNLGPNDFKGIQNLTYLDLSDNQITDITADTFKPVSKLTVLRLRGNLLKVAAISSLKGAQYLKELDLSSNALEGPLSLNTLPPLRLLESLQLSDNTFASIRRGALAGSPNLTYLNLHNNQIDVLEDYAFRHLTNLTNLDLSHNEIVAVSGASLAQLTSLTRLDLSHNFLRSLSAEPLKSLDRLTDLLLHDNDISMIDDGALTEHKDLKRFTIEDNPLNCDCLMAGFARWLREAQNLSQTDKSAAVCATPPHLEGALISRLSKNKLCDDFDPKDNKNQHITINKAKDAITDELINLPITQDVQSTMRDAGDKNFDVIFDENYVDVNDKGLDDDLYDEELDLPTSEDLPISKSKVLLQDSWHDDEEIYLSWLIEPASALRYRCTGITVAKDKGLPKHVACHRAVPDNVVVRGLKVDPGGIYTFCAAFEELNNSDMPLSLVLGCSAPRPIRQRAKFIIPQAEVSSVSTPVVTVPETSLRVSEVRSNVTESGLLTVAISLMGIPIKAYALPRAQTLTSKDTRYLTTLHNCYVILAVLSKGSLVAQKDSPCQPNLEISMEGFLRGPYEICASISKFKTDIQPICVVPQYVEDESLLLKSGFKSVNSALVGISLGLMVLVVGLVWFVRKMLKKPAEFDNHRCFREEVVVEEMPRTSYVMLTGTATSKV